MDSKERFLRAKGLTDLEISKAVEKCGELLEPAVTSELMFFQHSRRSWFRDHVVPLLVYGGFAYGCYWIFKEQMEAVISAVRELLGEDLFVPHAEVRHVDENGVDLIVTDEPEVKAEPPELEDDPLVCDPTDPLACHPKLEDPLALDPLECKPVLQGLASATHLQEPSIDYRPEAEPEALEPEHTGDAPFKPLGVEFCSPAHPGLESYDMSLAQCSGIDDFLCSDGWGDSHSIDGDPIHLDDQSSNDNHWPSIKRARGPTHYTYNGDDSDDSINEIDYEQPRTETDTEQDEINRPWVQVLSSQEQNITVSIKEHKTQKRRFPSPTSKGQNILAKQQTVQTKRPWVQVLANTEQKSTAKKKNGSEHIEDSICEQSSTVSEKQKHHKLEQSHFEQTSIDSKKLNNHRSEETRVEQSICEEQTSTESEIQNSNTLQSSEIQDTHEEQKSTVTAKRKRKFINVIKKPRYARKTQFTTDIQRDLEPTDRLITSDVRADSIDINVTTEPSNTLLNLEDYIREKVSEYPSDIEELM